MVGPCWQSMIDHGLLRLPAKRQILTAMTQNIDVRPGQCCNVEKIAQQAADFYFSMKTLVIRP